MRYTLIAVVAVSFCVTSPGQAIHPREAKYLPTEDSNYCAIANARFNFWFDIPKSWSAVDSSTNGDGYFILTGNPRVDARVYGSYIEFRRGPQQKIATFLFRDRVKGRRITEPGHVYFVRQMPHRQIIFYLASGDSVWLSQNRRVIERIAGSLRPGKKPYRHWRALTSACT